VKNVSEGEVFDPIGDEDVFQTEVQDEYDNMMCAIPPGTSFDNACWEGTKHGDLHPGEERLVIFAAQAPKTYMASRFTWTVHLRYSNKDHYSGYDLAQQTAMVVKFYRSDIK